MALNTEIIPANIYLWLRRSDVLAKFRHLQRRARSEQTFRADYPKTTAGNVEHTVDLPYLPAHDWPRYYNLLFKNALSFFWTPATCSVPRKCKLGSFVRSPGGEEDYKVTAFQVWCRTIKLVQAAREMGKQALLRLLGSFEALLGRSARAWIKPYINSWVLFLKGTDCYEWFLNSETTQFTGRKVHSDDCGRPTEGRRAPRQG